MNFMSVILWLSQGLIDFALALVVWQLHKAFGRNRKASSIRRTVGA